MDTLYLSQQAYPQEKVPLWAITAQAVEESFRKGAVPQILLPGFDYTASKPKIAIILAQDKHPDREIEDYTIFPDYVDAVIKAKGAPVFIVYDYVYEQLDLTSPDGILLIGGNFRLMRKHPQSPYERRPRTYVCMLKYAMQKNLPTFAICGGMQMMGVYKGCSINTHVNDKLNAEHSHRQRPYELSHPVYLQKGSLIYKILHSEKTITNTCHSSVLIENPKSDCLVSGRSPDGEAEVIEFYHPWSDFVLGVQWHPERLAAIGDEDSLKIFTAFIEAAELHRKKIAD